MSKRQYALHRWVGAIVGLQLFMWTLGGFMFSIHDVDWVHGEEQQNTKPTPVELAKVRLTPPEAAERLEAGDPVKAANLRMMLDLAVYELQHGEQSTLVDAENGKIRSPIDEATAIAIARARHVDAPDATSATLFESDPPIEYREKPLPAWLVVLDDEEGTHVWVAARTGVIEAWRNDAWRRFDFFWMLHTMDYFGRDDFNHPVLIGFAAVGLLSVITGGILWFLRLKRRFKRKAKPRPAS